MQLPKAENAVAAAETRRGHTGGATRSNVHWLDDLRDPRRRGDAVHDLRGQLRRGLRQALGRRGMTDHDVEDVLQDALVRILEHLDTFRGDSRFTTWAMAVALRIGFETIRRRRRECPVPGNDGGPDGVAHLRAQGADAGRWLDRRAVLRALQAAIDELTERQRTAVLGELSGVPTEELAVRLGITRNAFYKLHHDARRKLRRAIVAAGFTDEDVRAELAADDMEDA